MTPYQWMVKLPKVSPREGFREMPNPGKEICW